MASIKTLLNKLAIIVEKRAETSLKKDEYPPSTRSSFSWVLNDFEYTDIGPKNTGAQGKYSDEREWVLGAHKISLEIKKLKEYKDTLSVLDLAYPNSQQMEVNLDRFVSTVASNIFSKKRTRASILKSFIDDLNEKPIKHICKAKVHGIALERSINPVHGVLLRQSRREDFEEKVEQFFPDLHFPFLDLVPMVIETEVMSRNNNAALSKIYQSLAILKLFKVADVRSSSFSHSSDSVIEFAGRLGMPPATHGFSDVLLIKKDEEEKLKKFWTAIESILPIDQFGGTSGGSMSPTILAYEYYSDALSSNSSYEKRMASAVMGLEALLLNEKEELRYRLANRVARILSVIRGDSKYIRGVVKDAYDVRSSFAHGAALNHKEKRKLTDKYSGDIKNLFMLVMDYLRQVIVFQLLVKQEKDALIDLIDDAFIDITDSQTLDSQIQSVKDIL